jgi:hypothetical protein
MISSAVLSVVLDSAICLLSHDGGALIISNVVSDSTVPPLLRDQYALYKIAMLTAIAAIMPESSACQQPCDMKVCKASTLCLHLHLLASKANLGQSLHDGPSGLSTDKDHFTTFGFLESLLECSSSKPLP